MFRAIAKEKRLQLGQFNKLAEDSDNFDRWIDVKQGEEAMKHDNIIVECRLSSFFVPKAELKIWLKAPLEIRAQRVAGRERMAFEEALAAMKEREESEHKRYEHYYGIDLDDLSIYDLVIDSSRWRENNIVSMLLEALNGVKK